MPVKNSDLMKIFSAIGVTLLAIASSEADGSPATEIRTVETANATLTLVAKSGDLIGLHWKHPAVDIIGEPKLGENFRILLPKPGHEASYFNSRDQVLSRIEQSRDRLVLQYASLRNDQEEIPVKVAYEIVDTGLQLQFLIRVDNGTDRRLAEVLYGIIGGQQGIKERTDTESLIPADYANLAPGLFTQFSGGGFGGGNLGIRYEAAGYTYPGQMSMGWMDVFNRKAGVGYYYGNQDPETRVTALYTEFRPYTKTIAPADNWPSNVELPRGEPIGLTMGWVNFPYAPKGMFRAGPVALEVHKGDWHDGSAIYRSWFDQHFDVKRAPDWLRKEMAWQSIIISNPEDVIVHRFKELPKLARDAKKYGVTTFEILGWNIGGIDRGYPNYQPDPRLGTAEEFRNALAEMRASGVHPLLFANIQVADTATEEFRTKWSHYVIQGRWASDWPIYGWGEGTIGSRLGLARSNMTVVSPSHPEFRDFLVKQYLERIKDGAEGFQLDKTLIDGLLDFNSQSTFAPDKSLSQGILTTFKEYLEGARKINPNAALASENQFDRAFPYIDVSYLRMGTKDAPSVALRYTFPEWTSTIFGESPGDFDPINNGLRYGLVWALAPRHYNDSLDESLTQPLSRYVSELIRIRKRHVGLLFFGRFNDVLGATVTGNPESIRYSVFSPKDVNAVARACVIVNFGDQVESVDVAITGKDGISAEIDSPFQREKVATLPARLSVPPHRAMVVVTTQ